MLGNGSDELIQLLAIAFTGNDRAMLAPDPSFVMYRMAADALGMRYVGVPLGENFELDLDAMLANIAGEFQPIELEGFTRRRGGGRGRREFEWV